MDPWPAVVTVGFVAATALVVVLGRGSTARWERQRAAQRAERAERPAAAAPVGRLARLRAAGVRAGAGALHAAATVRRRVRPVAAADPGAAPTAPRGTPVRRAARVVRSITRGRRHGPETAGEQPPDPPTSRPRRRSLRLPRPRRRRGTRDPHVSPGP